MSSFSQGQLRHIQDVIIDVLRKELRFLIPQYLEHTRNQRVLPDPETDPLISRALAARILGVSIQTVSKMIKAKRLPCIKVQRRTLIRKSDINKLLENDDAKLDGGHQ
ncbi:MAG: helix-turn-helix domain-containing protein [Ignavibacteria bacterium]|nr:helix-turn-helix domain-containing protein [Ignavibacteria bacterium]